MPDEEHLPAVDGAANALVEVYARAHGRVQAALAVALDSGALGTASYRAATLQAIDAIMASLAKQTRGATGVVVDTAYRAGVHATDVTTDAGDKLGGFSWGGVHVSAVDVLTKALTDSLDESRQTVGREARDLFRQVVVEQNAVAVAAGGDRDEPAKQAKADLLAHGVTCFRDRAGRRWSLDNYCAMATRTTAREAASVATENRMVQAAQDLVTISKHRQPEADVCTPFEGNTYSLSGRDATHPRLEKRPPFHPRCWHVMFPAAANLDAFEAALAEPPPPPGPERTKLGEVLGKPYYDRTRDGATGLVNDKGLAFKVGDTVVSLFGKDTGQPSTVVGFAVGGPGNQENDLLVLRNADNRLGTIHPNNVEPPPDDTLVKKPIAQLKPGDDVIVTDDTGARHVLQLVRVERHGNTDFLVVLVEGEEATIDPSDYLGVPRPTFEPTGNVLVDQATALRLNHPAGGVDLFRDQVVDLGFELAQHIDEQAADAKQAIIEAQDAIQVRIEVIDARVDDLYDIMSSVRLDSPENHAKYSKARDEADVLTAEKSGLVEEDRMLRAQYRSAHTTAVRDTLAMVRPDFGTGTWSIAKRGAAGKMAHEAAANFPQEWVDGSNAHHMPVRVSVGGARSRGYYQHGDVDTKTFQTVGRVQARSLDVMTHELMHRVQYTLPDREGSSDRDNFGTPASTLNQLARSWHLSRVKGTVARKLKDLRPGWGYRDNEVAREDKYFDPYVGKEYNSDPREILTMGMQELWHGQLQARDEEMYHFMLGLLATA